MFATLYVSSVLANDELKKQNDNTERIRECLPCMEKNGLFITVYGKIKWS